MGKPELNDAILSCQWESLKMMSSQYEHMLRQYYYVGGMPNVVKGYVEHRDIKEVRREQLAIIESYRRDISKHTTSRESIRIGQVLSSLPSQLAKENKKFIYGAIRKGARAVDFELAIQWLIDAGITHLVPRVSAAKPPLNFYASLDAFKMFLLDCGLLGCMADAPPTDMLIDNKVFTEFKGAFTEQFVAQELISMGKKPYYWSNDRTPAEIDFIIQDKGVITPIEVKASTNVRSKSLAQFIKDNEGLKGLRLSLLPYCDQEWMENIPLYALRGMFSKS